MGAFKPMVKMETTEPSIELKLARGGHVKMKDGGRREEREERGHKRMAEACDEHFAEGGRAPGKPGMMERHRAMNPNFRKGGEVRKEEKHEDRKIERVESELKHHEREPAHVGHRGLKEGGKMMRKAEGGGVTSSMTKTTVEGNAGRFVSDISTAERGSKARRGTGDVEFGNHAGYREGGGVKGLATIETAERNSPAKRGTGDVALGNAGYKRGGKVEHKPEHKPEHKAERKAKGGEAGVGRAIEGNEERFAVGNITDGERHDGARGTGEVRFGNEGGYRKGGHARGKAYATGGDVQDDGRAVRVPRHPVSQPVANSLQSGTFKRGGHAKR